MLQTIKNAWKVPDIRKKIIFVLFILLLYRLGTVIPVPFVNHEILSAGGGALTGFGGIFTYLDLLSGGALASATLFALGVTPYINASIIMQLLSVAIPALERMSQEGEEGKKKINAITRVVTVALAIVTAIGYYFILRNSNLLVSDAMGNLGWFYAIVIIACFCAGASIVMWLAEKINETGLGNGISLILFANIISSLPSIISKIVFLFIDYCDSVGDYIWASVLALVVLIILIGLTVFIIFITGSERRIPIQYAKRTVGRKMYGGQSSNLPIKLNMAGVMPIIFASSICSLVPTIMMFCGVQTVAQVESAKNTPNFWNYFYDFCNTDGWFYSVMLFLLIIAFSYFYITISFNPVEVSNNLKKNGGMIPGIRQGKPTADFISKVLSKITFAGALFLGIIALLPVILNAVFFVPVISQIFSGLIDEAYVLSYASSYASAFAFGGTSILIAVGVVQETERELESQLTMRNYKGFLN